MDAIAQLSNPAATSVDLDRLLLECATALQTDPPLPRLRRPRQDQRRLSPEQVEGLLSAYRDGSTIRELSQEFGVHRTTVTTHLERAGVELRQMGLAPADVPAVIEAYRAGQSLATVGTTFGVDAKTISAALREAGEQARPRRGWPKGR